MKAKYCFRFFYDWGSTGNCLWSDNPDAKKRFGYGTPIEEFPLSPETINRVHEIGQWYQSALNWDYPPDPGPWRQAECDKFNRAVKQLFNTLGEELGEEFELKYLQIEQVEDPDLDEYLKNPQGFKRKV